MGIVYTRTIRAEDGQHLHLRVEIAPAHVNPRIVTVSDTEWQLYISPDAPFIRIKEWLDQSDELTKSLFTLAFANVATL